MFIRQVVPEFIESKQIIADSTDKLQYFGLYKFSHCYTKGKYFLPDGGQSPCRYGCTAHSNLCYNTFIMKKAILPKNKKKVLIACTVLWLLVIWGHSMMPASVSSDESNFVLDALNTFLGRIGLLWQFTSFAVRKAGHFTEFFILGGLLSKTLRTVFRKWPLPFETCAVAIGLLAAICDETIQHFTPGRAMLISDVMIDLSGVVVAVLIFFICRTGVSPHVKK